MNRSERATIRKLVTELCANYDSQDKICLPLNSPCYMLNKWWTGAYCRYFEKAVLPVDAALESAITGEDTSMRQKICPDRKSTRLNSSHEIPSRMPSSA